MDRQQTNRFAPPQDSGLLLRIALIVGTIEAGIMLLFGLLDIDAHGPLSALVDGGLLVGISTPLLYWWVVRPYIDERERRLAEVEFLAQHDALTKLPNRRLFDEHLRHALPRLRRHQRYGALLYFDLDGFKPINDEHGHDCGDQVLAEIGQRLCRSLREDEIAARVGGDEFVVLIGDAGRMADSAREQAEGLALRLNQLIREPIDLDGLRLQVGCTIGVHLLTPDSSDPRQALVAADHAMYQGKQRLRGSIVFSDRLEQDQYRIVPIGVDAIDREHRQIDRLIEASIEGSALTQENLNTLVQAIEQHFASEARIASDLGLQMTGQHLANHQLLLERFHLMQRDNDPNHLLAHILDIGKLMQQHVVEHDRELRHVNR